MLCYATSSTTCFGFNNMNGSRHSSKQEPYLRWFGVNCPTIIENITDLIFSLAEYKYEVHFQGIRVFKHRVFKHLNI